MRTSLGRRRRRRTAHRRGFCPITRPLLASSASCASCACIVLVPRHAARRTRHMLSTLAPRVSWGVIPLAPLPSAPRPNILSTFLGSCTSDQVFHVLLKACSAHKLAALPARWPAKSRFPHRNRGRNSPPQGDCSSGASAPAELQRAQRNLPKPRPHPSRLQTQGHWCSLAPILDLFSICRPPAPAAREPTLPPHARPPACRHSAAPSTLTPGTLQSTPPPSHWSPLAPLHHLQRPPPASPARALSPPAVLPTSPCLELAPLPRAIPAARRRLIPRSGHSAGGHDRDVQGPPHLRVAAPGSAPEPR